jgi:hypothetical protein
MAEGRKVTAAQLREMRKENLRWPVALAAVPREHWPADRYAARASSVRIALFRSRTFVVQVFEEKAGIVRLSVNRTEWDERQRRFRDDISWDDLQRLKAEAGYGDRCAYEVLPPDRLVVNVANMRHFFVLPAGEMVPCVWGATTEQTGAKAVAA